MHEISLNSDLPKQAAYQAMNEQLAGLFSGERNGLANCANMCALLYQLLPRVNWAGFYFLHGEELVLGPFQGKVACVRIRLGHGVCGTAALRGETLLVPDVHDFPGHIACDAASRSEIVVPIIQQSRVLGVLDLDSPDPARFDDDDRRGLDSAVRLLLQSSDLGELAD